MYDSIKTYKQILLKRRNMANSDSAVRLLRAT